MRVFGILGNFTFVNQKILTVEHLVKKKSCGFRFLKICQQQHHLRKEG